MPLVLMAFLTFYLGCQLAKADNCVPLVIMFAICLAIVILFSTMCAGLVGVIVGFGIYAAVIVVFMTCLCYCGR